MILESWSVSYYFLICYCPLQEAALNVPNSLKMLSFLCSLTDWLTDRAITLPLAAHMRAWDIYKFLSFRVCQMPALLMKNCDWSAATKWVEWWMQPRHLQMLHKGFSLMDGSVWDRCAADNNAVERKNQDSEDIPPQQLQSAVINL